MELRILQDIIIIFGLSIFVIFLFYKLHLPSITGFLVTGLITGPYGLKLIRDTHDVEILAEIGIVLLLFTIGIEFSIKNLIKARKSVLLGGTLQTGLVIVFTFIIARITGLNNSQSVFVGFLVALSSTAIVMKVIQNRGELGTYHGQTSLAILIFQDIIIVPMILITPLLAGELPSSGQSFLIVISKGLGVLILIILGAKYFVPYVLHQIARTQSNELFLLTIIVIAFATAWLTSAIGLSLALGAFIAGLIISESEYSEHAFGNIIPFRDLFTSFFFVSIGMLLNIDFIIENILLVTSTALGIILLKAIIIGFVAFLLGYPFRTTLIVGISLSQIGEFSFVLSEYGIEYGLLSEFNNQLFLSSAVISLSVTPFLINNASSISEWILKLPLPKKLRSGLNNLTDEESPNLRDHVVIIGYGVIGRNVAKAAKYAKIPHVIIELNPDTVKEEMAKGEIIYYGDATQELILNHANIKDAYILVNTIPNPADSRLITLRARKLNNDLHIIIRTRFIRDMDALYKLGANEVIPEEFETSVEIFARVLAKYVIPQEEIDRLVQEIRVDEYKMFRKLSLSPEYYEALSVHAPVPEFHSISLAHGSHLIGKSFGQCNFPEYKIVLVAINRAGENITKVESDFTFEEGDTLFFLGNADNFKSLSLKINKNTSLNE
ncbi:MAG: cation:proton antiporter [Bacteroidales bacterium]|nr:cation:proton antiporter [Bacteroidales bacterium]MCF8403978.1 cation:proton antiporter [Bacteroidales bacterium]